MPVSTSGYYNFLYWKERLVVGYNQLDWDGYKMIF
jgi:hypothetical protein